MKHFLTFTFTNKLIVFSTYFSGGFFDKFWDLMTSHSRYWCIWNIRSYSTTAINEIRTYFYKCSIYLSQKLRCDTFILQRYNDEDELWKHLINIPYIHITKIRSTIEFKAVKLLSITIQANTQGIGVNVHLDTGYTRAKNSNKIKEKTTGNIHFSVFE